MNRVRTFAAVLGALAALAGCSKPAPPKTAQPLRIGWVQAMANAPAVIAEHEGFYRDEGLNVQLKSFADGPLIQQALAARELDAAYVGAAPVMQWAQRGFQSRILAKVNTGQAALIARTDGPVTSLATLRGAKVAGGARGSGMDVFLRGYLLGEAAHLKPDSDVTVINMPAANMPQALATKAADAAFTWEPFISQAVLRGDARVVFDSAKALPGHPWYVVMAPVTTLQARPDDVVRLLKAHRRAVRFMHDHPAEADAVIIQAFKLQPIKAEDGSVVQPAAIVAEARKRLDWSDALTDADVGFFQRMVDWSRALGYATKPVKAADLVDRSYAEKAGR